MRHQLRSLMVFGLCVVSSPGWAWQHRVILPPAATPAGAVAVSSHGDVVTAVDGGAGNTSIVQLDVHDGRERWHNDTVAGANTIADVAFDSVGDVYGGGGTNSGALVFKLAGASGATQWQTTLTGTDRHVRQVVPVAGAVVVLEENFNVVRLNPSTGAEIWRRQPPSDPTDLPKGLALAADAAGNVVAAGLFDNPELIAGFVVAKFAPDGGLVWMRQLDFFSVAQEFAIALAFTPNGDVIAVGGGNGSGAQGVVVRLGGEDGLEAWRTLFAAGSGAVRDVVSAGGPVLVGGAFEPVPGGATALAALDATSGHNAWTEDCHTPAAFATGAVHLAADQAGGLLSTVWCATTPQSAPYDPAEILGDNMIQKVDADGAQVWRHDLGAVGLRRPLRLHVDTVGNAIVASVGFDATSGGQAYVIEKLRAADGLTYSDTCGNGVTDAGETCDHGAQNGSDGCCSADCAVEDADGDGLCDHDDPCSTSAGVSRSKLSMRRLLAPAADETLKLQTTALLPTPVAPLTFATNGLKLTLTGARGPIDTLVVPGGVYASVTGGWKQKSNAGGTSWKYASARGLTPGVKVTLKTATARPGQLSVRLSTRAATYAVAAADLPVSAALAIDPLSGAGRCAEVRFPGAPAGACTLAGGATLSCR